MGHLVFCLNLEKKMRLLRTKLGTKAERPNRCGRFWPPIIYKTVKVVPMSEAYKHIFRELSSNLLRYYQPLAFFPSILNRLLKPRLQEEGHGNLDQRWSRRHWHQEHRERMIKVRSFFRKLNIRGWSGSTFIGHRVQCICFSKLRVSGGYCRRVAWTV